MNTNAQGSPSSAPASAGDLIREWRMRRRMSQLDLASEADVSQRHLSFVESGRSLPSREMVLHLAECLDVPLRERNRILLAAGYAPTYSERPLSDAALSVAMQTVDLVLKGHEPNPAMAVDRHWNLIKGNAAIGPFLQGVEDETLLRPPVNVLRLSLHPKGLAPRIVNLLEWRDHLIERLRRLNAAVADPGLVDLETELAAYPMPRRTTPSTAHRDFNALAATLRIRAGDKVLSFITTITVFGTPLEVALSELAVESFFPADADTAELLHQMAAEAGLRN